MSYRRMMPGPGWRFAAWFAFCCALAFTLAAVVTWAAIKVLLLLYAG